MKNSILTLLLSVPVFLSAQEGFKIEARLSKTKGEIAYLNYRTTSGSILDSTIIKDGKFTFTGKVDGPTQASIMISSKNNGSTSRGAKDVYTLYIDKGTTKLEAVDSVKYAKLSGSELGVEYVKYNKIFSDINEKLSSLDRQWSKASAQEKSDGKLAQKLRTEAKPLNEEKIELQKLYLNENPDSYFSLIALQQLAGSKIDVAIVEPLFNRLNSKIKDTPAGKEFAKRIQSAYATAIGAIAPDFVQNDVNDKPVKLSDFRGKYVLLDFWASWCGPCRAENPNVVKAYHEFKEKNFTILGVSLDNPGKRDLWLKAIADDNLDWTNVSDLKGWKNEVSVLYGVRSIPQNYLISPDGKIIATNLRGEALHEKLAELLK